jgi:hypothetical protein
MHEIKVESVSPEEASFGVTELWVDGALVAYTRYEDGDLMLRIEPSHDGGPVAIGVRGLTDALAEIDRILAVRQT